MAQLARVAAGGVRRRVRRADRWPLPTSIHSYQFDGLGSAIALTDSSGSVVNLYEYSVYGEVSASDPNHPNRFLFTGREFDKDTGLYYYRARYYNPYIGRFLQTDPVCEGINPYAYCANDPVGSVDPSGAVPMDWLPPSAWPQPPTPLVDEPGGWTYANQDWDYMIPDSTRHHISAIPPARYLMLWYAMGQGGVLWWDWAALNADWAAGNPVFRETLSKSILGAARGYYWYYTEYKRLHDIADFHWPDYIIYGLGVSFTYPGDPGPLTMLIGGGTVYFDARITISDNHMIFEGYMLYADYMDLHPDKYPDYDGVWKRREDAWNQIMALCRGPCAQAYPMYIPLGFHSFSIWFDDAGEPMLEPGNWPTSPPSYEPSRRPWR